MDVTQTAHLFGGVAQMIEKIRLRLKKEVGEYITASFGISYNKLLAKLASGLEKPNGLVEIQLEHVVAVYASAQLLDICGIGQRIKLRLNQMGIYTLIQLRLAPLRALVAEFGQVEGNFLKDVGLAIDKRPVIPFTEAPSVKSVGRNYCLPQNEYDQRKVLQNVYELCEEVALKLRRLRKKARTVGIYLRGKSTVHGRKTYAYYIDTGKEMFEQCLSIVNQVSGIRYYDSDKAPLIRDSLLSLPSYVRQIGIWVSNLEDARNVPASLFVDEKKRERILSIVDKINEKFGDHTIRNGFLLYAEKLTTVPNGYMADTFERSKLAQET